jgi:hypothetical protein
MPFGGADPSPHGGAKARLDACPGHAIEVHLTLTDGHPWAGLVMLCARRWSLIVRATGRRGSRGTGDRTQKLAVSDLARDQRLFWVLAVLAFHSFVAKPFISRRNR